MFFPGGHSEAWGERPAPIAIKCSLRMKVGNDAAAGQRAIEHVQIGVEISILTINEHLRYV